jgi:hypothetical protein
VWRCAARGSGLHAVRSGQDAPRRPRRLDPRTFEPVADVHVLDAATGQWRRDARSFFASHRSGKTWRLLCCCSAPHRVTVIGVGGDVMCRVKISLVLKSTCACPLTSKGALRGFAMGLRGWEQKHALAKADQRKRWLSTLSFGSLTSTWSTAHISRDAVWHGLVIYSCSTTAWAWASPSKQPYLNLGRGRVRYLARFGCRHT